MIVKIISKIFSRNRQDCTDSISTLVIIEENNKVLSDLPPSYASMFPIRVGIQKNLPANNFMLQQQMTVCGNCMGCIEYNMCMQYQKVMMNWYYFFVPTISINISMEINIFYFHIW